MPQALCYAAQTAAAQGDADGARARLKETMEMSLRNDDWFSLTQSLDVAVNVFSYRGNAQAAAVLSGAVETTLATLLQSSPDFSRRGHALAARTANLDRARQELGDSRYEQARAEGTAMSQEGALAFALQHL
jgi:hypothetical protein